MAEKKQDITEMSDIKSDYKPAVAEIPEEVKKEMEKTKTKLEQFKKYALKKYPFIISIGILPPQITPKFEEDEDMSEEERKEKPMHLVVLIPEEKFKDAGKIKLDLIKQIKSEKPKIWLHMWSPVDVWNFGLDSKYELVSGIAMSFPLYDKGFLGSMRVAEIHKSLVLRKFEKYVVSYVVAGSLVRGQATKTSDVDAYIIIDDTDVKRMPRLELKEKLRAIIYSYMAEAGELATVKNKLNVQVYILTEFWESVKDAHPVIFTFIRDGIPMYDRGAFLPWKLLLRMGKIKPSPEAIDMFMSMGDKTKEIVERRLVDLVVGDIYWGVLTPSQALLMLYGLPPPTHKETAPMMEEIFVKKEKMLEKKYVDILDKIVKTYKDYEHEKIKTVSGKQVDEFAKDSEIYLKRLKELREQIEKRAQEKTIEQIYEDVFKLLKSNFGNKSQNELINEFENKLVKKGKVSPNALHVLKEIVKARQEFKKGKLARHEVEDARKNASKLINELIEFGQRCDLVSLDKGKLQIKYKEKGKEKEQEKIADLLLTDNGAFLVQEGKVFKVTNKLEPASQEEFDKAISEQKGKLRVKSTSHVFDVLRKELGEFEIII